MTDTTSTRGNVDSNEIAKFDAMASRWWDPEGECKPLHEINPYAWATSRNAPARFRTRRCWTWAVAAAS